ncbi:MAG: hypothetical protein WC238_03385 [Parcubacteria group bacterium]|jgi:hypothetical protein
MNITLLFSNLGLSASMSQNVMLLIFVALLSFVYGMLLGKHKLMSVLINIYVAFAVVSVIPAKTFADYNQQILLFLGILVVMTILDKRFFDISLSGSGSSFLFRVFSMSFLEIILVLSIIFSYTPAKVALGYISSDAYTYLVTGWAPLVWMVAPLAYMFFIYKKINH